MKLRISKLGFELCSFGATFAASLESELFDSAWLGYLRPSAFAAGGGVEESLFFRYTDYMDEDTAKILRARLIDGKSEVQVSLSLN